MKNKALFEHGVFWSVGCNPLTIDGGYFHCTKISPGCDRCWAESIARKSGGPPYDDRPVSYQLDRRKLIALHGLKQPQVVFMCHLMDLFHARAPIRRIVEVFQAMIEMPQHRFIVLTKRAENMKAFFESTYRHTFGSSPLPGHIGIGVSCESHEYYIRRAALLAEINAEMKIVSFAPLLGAVRFDDPKAPTLNSFNWVLAEGESIGPHAGRICDLHWISDIVLEGHSQQVPVWVKQIHVDRRLVRQYAELPAGTRVREVPLRWMDTFVAAGLAPPEKRGLFDDTTATKK